MMNTLITREKGMSVLYKLVCLSFILTMVVPSKASDFLALDEALPSASDASSIAPVFDFDSDSCLPSAGISRDGEINGGLAITGSITGSCRSSDFLDTSNTLHRYACQESNGALYCGHMYALYFEKDQMTLVGIGGHRHDWEFAVIWTTDGVITHASVSAHGDVDTEAFADVPSENDHLKVVYHKDGVGTHVFRFAKTDEDAENPYGYFVTPTIASWYVLTGDNISNSTMRELMNEADYGNANLSVSDDHFLDNLTEAKPSSYPDFSESDVTASAE